MQSVQSNTRLGELLQWCERRGVTDIHVQAGKPLVIRVQGKLQRIPENTYNPLPEDAIFLWLGENFSPELCAEIRNNREVDLSFYHSFQRYRANFSKQKGAQSFSFRIVPQQRQKLSNLNLPASLHDLTREPRGLILVTGPTGQGKSTTLRALIQEMNENSALRIVTIEDPIEYVFEDYQSQFEQREVGIDTDTFASGIRNAMRQDPNVIFIGEIRDKDSIYAAMQAAETGHLILTTLHADSVAQAIARIREFYPTYEQDNISNLLSRNLNAIICQRLIPSVGGSRIPALEIMKRDKGTQDAIQTNNLHLLNGIVEASVGQGMHSFDQYIIELLSAGMITQDVARHYSINKHRLDMLLRGIVTNASILKPDQR
ncbi:MAG TPA: PilT/PilU family type 4a pilus ATPase [Candidatus Kapabacteria bacterium]|nr:PilT/PilU family type 4a pilus ATPase [Candidatus Kapabacteria bacterium]